jgi:hypothetical protein
MSIDAEEAAIRTVIVGALMGHSEPGERGFDASTGGGNREGPQNRRV